jgi:protein Mpv17
MTPICVAGYLSTLGLLEGQEHVAIVKEVQEKGPSLLVVEWTFGPATQVFNFVFLPTRFRVLYDSIVCLCFDAYYSYVKYRKGLKDGETTDDVTVEKPSEIPILRETTDDVSLKKLCEICIIHES